MYHLYFDQPCCCFFLLGGTIKRNLILFKIFYMNMMNIVSNESERKKPTVDGAQPKIALKFQYSFQFQFYLIFMEKMVQ
jgi:hypothetical protein